MANASNSCILKVTDLSVRRGNTQILRTITWGVNRGEHWVILGANGSGKTSLLSALTAYLTPTSGSIELLNRRYGQANWPELRQKIGLVSSSIRQLMPESEPALESVVSGKYAMIDYWGRVRRADRTRARRLLRQIECEHLAERPWLYLSQGERQRILIGRALMARPRILILDEPCAGLDPAAREHFLQFLQRLGGRSSAPALILVTHHVEEIMPVFTHVLALKEGQVIGAGLTAQLMNSRLLSEVFGSKIRLEKRSHRYQLKVSPSLKRVM